jgi:hypothetical protein
MISYMSFPVNPAPHTPIRMGGEGCFNTTGNTTTHDAVRGT